MPSTLVRSCFGLCIGGFLALNTGQPLLAAAPDEVTLEVANPSPGSRVMPGKLVMQGVALDSRAPTHGVDAVSVFLGDRDTGGRYLGGVSSAANGSWILTTDVLHGAGAQRTLFVYARSAVTGQEVVEQIAIVIGEKVHVHVSAAPSGESVIPIPPGCIVQPRPECTPTD